MQVRDKTLQLFACHADEASRENIGMDSDIDAIGLDSLALFEIVYELEECFAVELGEDELARVKTLRELAECIERKLAGAG